MLRFLTRGPLEFYVKPDWKDTEAFFVGTIEYNLRRGYYKFERNPFMPKEEYEKMWRTPKGKRNILYGIAVCVATLRNARMKIASTAHKTLDQNIDTYIAIYKEISSISWTDSNQPTPERFIARAKELRENVVQYLKGLPESAFLIRGPESVRFGPYYMNPVSETTRKIIIDDLLPDEERKRALSRPWRNDERTLRQKKKVNRRNRKK
jgi:hypothetical protein